MHIAPLVCDEDVLYIEPTSPQQALECIGWKSPSSNDSYNIHPSDDEDILKEILQKNDKDYYSVHSEAGELLGIFLYTYSDRVLEISLGLKPGLFGQGLDEALVVECILFCRESYSNYKGMTRLMIADFNTRAIHLYDSMGFLEVCRKEAVIFGTPVTLVIMDLEGSKSLKLIDKKADNKKWIIAISFAIFACLIAWASSDNLGIGVAAGMASLMGFGKYLSK